MKGNLAMDNAKYLFMITGAAGAGKSTLAGKLQDAAPTYIGPIAEICEADEFFYIIGKGKYAFNPKLLWKAHQWCQNQAEKVMETGKNLIVSNTNVKPSDRKPYFQLAEKYGYKVVYIHLTTQFKSVHDVPEDAVKRMRDNYTDLSDYERGLVVGDDMSEDLKKLLEDVGA